MKIKNIFKNNKINNILSEAKKYDLIIITLAYLFLIPFLKTFRLADFMVFTIFVLSYDLLYGFMGRLSMGHMLYLGTGAYATTLFAKHISSNPFLAILFGILAGALIGILLGPITVKTKGAKFALINMAFNNLGYFMVISLFARYTGGQDGMTVNFQQISWLNLYNPNVRFYFMLIALLLTFYLVKKLTTSHYGILLKSIQENESRARFLGYNTYKFKYLTFVLSTSLAAFSGALWVINLMYVSPSLISPARNVEVIFAILIGGAGNPYGALIGGTLFMTISNYLAAYIQRWEMFLGITLLFFIFKLPIGITGYISNQAKDFLNKVGGDAQ